MTNESAAGLSRLIDRYRGIENFYFLNRGGELGYISRVGMRSVKESFPEVNRREFLYQYPAFIMELERFLRDLIEVAVRCDSPYAEELELGYVLPAGDGQRWRSATLVLHDQIIDQLRQDSLAAGGDSGTESKAKLRRFRSVQQGFDDLIHHRDSSGRLRFFPALFYRSSDDPAQATAPGRARSRLRVVNLKWRPAGGVAPRVRDSAAGPDAEDNDVYDLLRGKLISRGAIDRSLRLEQRLRELSIA